MLLLGRYSNQCLFALPSEFIAVPLDVILVRDDPRDVPSVVDLSRATYRKMVQNLAWATGYNVVAIPFAAGILAPIGIVLPPAVGALLMSASTVVVDANAQLLRRS